MEVNVTSSGIMVRRTFGRCCIHDDNVYDNGVDVFLCKVDGVCYLSVSLYNNEASLGIIIITSVCTIVAA